MKALVLAGGSGTRLRPITHTSAKQLIPVANKPVLFYGLEQLRDAGITDIGIIVGDTRAEVMAAVGDGSELGIQVTYIPQDAPLGLAHAVLIARDFLGDDDFCMFLGDNFLLGGVSDFVAEFESSTAAAQILLTEVAEPQFYGVAVLDEAGSVVQMVEKPANPPSNLAVVGVYLFRSVVHDAVRAIEPSARGELEITDAIAWLIAQDLDVRSHLVTGYWKDTGRLEDMLECNRRVLEGIAPDVRGDVDAESQLVGRVVIEEGATIVRSTVRGPAIIGRGTHLEDSYVGPFTSIYHGCTITGTELEHSIILEDCVITGAGRIEDSLLGKSVTVVRSEQVPRAQRLMLGDHSTVSLP
ncbi:glucose-1-phosphate thymidylyltransferase [Angustibacter sp. McL0619]|uniref:glucose-1-phosphate thymidylyltransferase n=1 Tax=Angustibacter sp. McL0619 TaxID=3415676 RepID=UPI003CEB8BA0